MQNKSNMGDFLFLTMMVTTLLIVLFPEGIDTLIEAFYNAGAKMLALFDECATSYLIFRGNVFTDKEMKVDATSDGAGTEGD
jgi:inosine-uridine nucleoside N-ribohydrolase